MRRKLQEILCDAKSASAEEIQLVIDELDTVKSKLKEIRLKKLEDSLYERDDNEPWWQKWNQVISSRIVKGPDDSGLVPLSI